MLGHLSRNQLVDIETLLSSSSNNSSVVVNRFDGTYIDPYRFTLVHIRSNNTNKRRQVTREVFEAMWKWDALQASTYVLWWAFRPNFCKACGSVDHWKPSSDYEYVCPQCFTGAGTTNLQNDIVQENLEDDSASEGGDSDAGGGAAGDGIGAGGGLGGAALGTTGAGGGGGGGGDFTSGFTSSGNIYSASNTTAANIVSSTAMANWVMDTLRKLRFLHLGIASQLDTALFPAILKVTLNITTLLYLPDMPSDGVEALRAACFYVACSVVIPSVVSFPSVQSVVADATTMQQIIVQNNNNNNQNNQTSTSSSPINDTNNNSSSTTDQQQQQQQQQQATIMIQTHFQPSNVDVRWTDVLYVSSMLGVEVDDFFNGDSRQHTRNLVALMEHQPSGKLYDTARSQKAQKILIEMKKRAAEIVDINQKEKFSPDHTAAIFVLECGRQQPELVKEWKQLVFGGGSSSEESQQQQQQQVNNNNNNNTSNCSQNISLLSSSSSSTKELWLLLVCLAEAVRMTPASFTEMVERSGLYGEKIGFYGTLQRRLSCGDYPVPLTRRLTPCVSPWNAVFRALHSADDRLPFLAALKILSSSPDAHRRHSAALSVVQQILRKHGSLMVVSLNYVLQVSDPTFPTYQGLYFCTQIDRRGALYMSLTQNKSIRFMGAAHQVYLNESSERNAERLVASHIACQTVDPICVALETQATKLVIDCVQKNQTVLQSAQHAWFDAAAKLSVCAQLRKKANACLPAELVSGAVSSSSAHHSHHSHSHSGFSTDHTNDAATYNRLKCSVLLDIKGLIANEKKNPSWTTSVLFSHDALQVAASKTGDPRLLQQELIERGILSSTINQQQQQQLQQQQQQQNESQQQQQAQEPSSSSTSSVLLTNEAIFSLHHRTRLFALSRLGDLEVLVLNSTMNALNEYYSGGGGGTNNSPNFSTTTFCSPALKPFSQKSSPKHQATTTTAMNNNNSNNDNAAATTKNQQQQSASFSPSIGAQQQQQSSNNNNQKEAGKRRSRSESQKQQQQQQSNNKVSSPKMQPLPPPAAVAATASSSTTTTTTTIVSQNQQQPQIILPPGFSSLFASPALSSAKEELIKRI